MDATDVVAWTRDPAVAISANGHVLAVNGAFERLTRSSAPGLIGRSCAELTVGTGDTPGGRACIPAQCSALRSVAAGSTVRLSSCPLRRPIGSPAAMELTAITVPPEGLGEAAAVLILCAVSAAFDVPSSPPQGTTVSLRFLGRPEYDRGGATQRVPRRRVLELLALLALDGTGVPRSRVIDTLWPEADPTRARAHLRVLLHSVRHALGSDVLEEVVTEGDGREPRLYLGRDVWTDVAAFRGATNGSVTPGQRCSSRALLDPEGRLKQIDSAIKLYRGDLDEDALFGEWSAAHRERLRMQLLGLLAEAAPLAMALGDIERSVWYCERAIEVDPIDEAFRIALITTYGYLGRSPAALAQYRDYERVLALELGLRPPLTTDRALRQALNGPLPGRRTTVARPTG